ncbi:MAG: ACP S-malonyltransferase [Myxococcales bacterium]
MGKVAFVFPGQGAQKVGMGKAAHDETDAGRAVFEAADAALGESLSGLCFEGPEDQLQLTANTQPAILTTSIALLRGLDAGCDVTAGHSLGEYSAHVAAGTLAFDDAVRLVRQRGQYMQEAVPVGEGAMAAVLGGDLEAIEKACADTPGVVEPVNYNCPGQLVIAGAKEAVEQATARIKEAGAKVRPLPVSAPFHSSLMRPAEDNLRPHLEQAAFNDPSVPVYVNVDAAPVTTAAAARDALARQVSRAVRWEQAIRRMLEDGVTLFVEIGPGKVLSGMLRRIEKDAGKANVETPADFDGAREAIVAHRG